MCLPLGLKAESKQPPQATTSEAENSHTAQPEAASGKASGESEQPQEPQLIFEMLRIHNIERKVKSQIKYNTSDVYHSFGS